mmetsp:Transcript_2132/g.4657  ORF Transcript_2132/g.4657 Transcript_2132/m.4657 type:complete len:106 (+) Transcript_2132:162-479(+)
MTSDKILSSLPLQILLYFHGYYSIIWFAINLVIFLWKSYRLYYTTYNLRWELALVFLLPCMDACRIKLASMGNKTERLAPLAWSCGLAAPTIFGFCFFLKLQTYV